MWVEVLILMVVVVAVRYWMNRPKGLPPGPRVIPFVGSATNVSIDDVRANRKKYGDIHRLEIGTSMFIFLCDYKMIREAFNRADIIDRPQMEIANIFSDGVSAGVIMTNGQQWQNARRFLLRHLRDLGMGKTYLEGAIHTEAKELVQDFKKIAGTPTNFPKSINVAVLNVVWQLVASTRYELDNDQVLSIVNIIRSLESSAVLMFLESFPSLKRLIPNFIINKIPAYRVIGKFAQEIRALSKDIITTHRDKLDPTNPRDVVDEYLLAMDEKQELATYFSELDLTKIIFDLFNAGFDTTSNMLRWIILYMIKYPEVQERVQKEIDEVVPRDTLPSYQHKSQLPLVEAMVHEVLRMGAFIAIGVQHTPSRDVQVAGYNVPEGSFVFGCTFTCHEDPRYWEDPDTFKLERFLDKEGKFVSQKEGFLPFGVGRRNCLGESLARMELYIFSAALLQNFTFSMPEGQQVIMAPDKAQPAAKFPTDQNIMVKVR